MTINRIPKIVATFNFTGDPVKLRDDIESDIMPTIRAEVELFPNRDTFSERVDVWQLFPGGPWQFYPKTAHNDLIRPFDDADEILAEAYKTKIFLFVATELTNILGVSDVVVDDG